jgi:hypothetical protein
MADVATLIELDRRIAAIRANLRELTEQASAFSGAGDEDRISGRIEAQEARLADLIKERGDEEAPSSFEVNTMGPTSG